MKIIILKNDGCTFILKNGKEVKLKGFYYVNKLSDDDFNNLITDYPHIKLWAEKGYITFNDTKIDNFKTDTLLENEKDEKERSKKAVEIAVNTIKNQQVKNDKNRK